MIEPTHQAYQEIQSLDKFLTKCNQLFKDPYQDDHPSSNDTIHARKALSYVDEYFHQHGIISVPNKWLKEVINHAEGEDWTRVSRYIKDANNELMGISRVFNDTKTEMKREKSYSKIRTGRQSYRGDDTLRLNQIEEDHPDIHKDDRFLSTPLEVQYIKNSEQDTYATSRQDHPDAVATYAHHTNRREQISRHPSIIDETLRSELRLPLEKIDQPPTPVHDHLPDPEVIATLERARETEKREEMIRKTIAITKKNANLADLSDVNRPSKIADKFSRLYDDLWTDACEELTTLYNQHGNGERRAILDLAVILKKAFEFTEKHVETQIEKIAHQTREIMLDPCSDGNQDADIHNPFRHDKMLGQFACVCIKDTADLSVEALQKHFRRHVFPNEAMRTNISDIPSVKRYTDKCIELTWYMNVQDPPMVLVWPDMTETDSLTDYFRYCTATGSVLDHEVWPALLLCKDGPMVVKGVAQFK